MKTANIAIFENNEDFLHELKESVEKVEGFTVSAATSNGNAAIDYLKQARPDVAIVDLVLSGRDGLSVLKYIKQNNIACMPIAIGSYLEDKIVNSAIGIYRSSIYYDSSTCFLRTAANSSSHSPTFYC